MKILLTGFDPFGGESVNPALEAVKAVGQVDGAQIYKLEIPTVFKKGPEAIFNEIERIKPDVVLSIGQAGGRSGITVEYVGINCVDARIEDNEGNQPKDERIYPDGPDAYFSTLPVQKIVADIKEAGIPAFVSYTAGSFVCNDVLYSVSHYISENAKKIKSGFIHVPFVPEQTVNKPLGTPSMDVDDIRKAIELAIETIVKEG